MQKDIDENYRYFIEKYRKENIDFWGININDREEKPLIYKVYCSQTSSKNWNHQLIEFVHQRGMLRYFEDVNDFEDPEQKRIDVSLYHRNDTNIDALFRYLDKTVPFFSYHIDDVKSMAQMKITNIQGYKYSSIYHVGLIENKNEPELLKFHFFTRWCENPNDHSSSKYRDEEYLKFFKNSSIMEYQLLGDKAYDIYRKCGGHLWMAGMDLGKDKRKYKIYLKEIKNAYEYLADIMGNKIGKYLNEIERWNKNHKECRLAGVAVALDSEGVDSLNLYYHLD